jgi:hypothetical protein
VETVFVFLVCWVAVGVALGFNRDAWYLSALVTGGTMVGTVIRMRKGGQKSAH